MNCFNSLNGINALLGATLVIAGVNLMMHVSTLTRGFGAVCFTFGYLLIGVSASDHSINNFDYRNTKYMIGLGSALAVVAGTFMMYYNVQSAVDKLLTDDKPINEDIINSVPIIAHLLIYSGYVGIVLTMALNYDNTVNIPKAILGAGALAVIGYTKHRLLTSVVQNKNIDKAQIAHLASWGLLVLAISYSC